MNAHHTKIELCGEEYAAVVLFEWDENPIIKGVTIYRSIHNLYNTKGEYSPHVERISVDITAMLNDDQIDALSNEIVECSEEAA